MKKRLDKLFLALFIISLIAAAVMAYNIHSWRNQYAALEEEYAAQKAADAARVSQLETSLSEETAAKEAAQAESSSWEKKYEAKAKEYGTLSEAYDALNIDYKGLKREVTDIKEEIKEYEAKLDESMAWFSENSVLDNDKAEMHLFIDCVDTDDKACYIKTGCLHLVNTENMGYRYLYDITTSDEADKLQSLAEFAENKGGDCEDYALFYKAEWNYLLYQCEKDKMVSDIVVNSWYGHGNDRHWLDFDKDWYLQDVNEISFKDGRVHPNVVCGSIFDFYRGGYFGHCIIALTSSPVESIEDMGLLDDAIFIEPQTGEYFRIGAPFVMRAGKDPQAMDSFIYSVITDTDYFLYNFENEEWQGYSYFKEKLEEKKAELD